MKRSGPLGESEGASTAPPEASPPRQLRRRSRRSEAEHHPVGGKASASRPGYCNRLPAVGALMLLGSFLLVPAAVSRAADTLRVAYSSVSGSQTAIYVAKESGMFERYGLQVELILIEGATKALKAMLAGEVPIAHLGGAAMAASSLEGSGIVMVAAAENTTAYSLVTAKDVTHPRDLKGHAIAIATFGGSSDFAIRFALEKFGLDPRKDVTLLQVGGQSTRYAALQSGRVKATLIVPPFAITARKQGFNVLADLADMGFEYQGNGVVATSAFVRTNPDTVRNFLKAYVAGIHFMKTRKEETLKILAKHLKLDDREALEETHRVFATQIAPRKPYPTLKGFQAILDELAEKNPKAKDTKPEQLVDTRLLRELDQSGFIDALYR